MNYLKIVLAYLWFLTSVLIGLPVVFCMNTALALMYGMQESLEITKEIYNEIKMDLMKAL